MNIDKKVLTPDSIIQLLSRPVVDRRPITRTIAVRASLSALLLALEHATSSHVKEIVSNILGNRHNARAVPSLLNVLTDSSSGVRASAADALAKIRNPTAGPTLLSRFRAERNNGVRQMLALALGATGYRPSAAALIASLTDKSGALRGCAAWSLGILRVREANKALRHALTKEKDKYAANRMKEALEQINK